MTADCKLKSEGGYDRTAFDRIPILRGTHGLWKHFPVLKHDLVTFEDFVAESFFKQNPHRFWYVYGEIYNR